MTLYAQESHLVVKNERNDLNFGKQTCVYTTRLFENSKSWSWKVFLYNIIQFQNFGSQRAEEKTSTHIVDNFVSFIFTFLIEI